MRNKTRARTPDLLAGAVLIAIALGACSDDRKGQLQARLQNTEAQLTLLRTTTSQRDSLYDEVMRDTRFVNEVQAELSLVTRMSKNRGRTVRLASDSAERPARGRDEILRDLRGMIARLDSVEQRAMSLTGKSDERTRTSPQITLLRETIASLRASAIQQQGQADQLSAELATIKRDHDALTRDHAALAKERVRLADKLLAIEDENNTVFYVARPIAQLLELHIVTEEGARRSILGLGGRKAIALPARDLHESDFTALSLTADTLLTLPHPDRRYLISSRHDGQLLSPPASSDGTIPGRVRITDARRFWAASRFLVLIER
jgi:hypothetical protein